MRLATFNVENLFDRPRIMNLPKWTDGAKVLKDYARLTDLIGQDVYSSSQKKEMLTIMGRYPGLSSPQKKDSTYIRLRDIRGAFLKKPQGKPVEIAAAGRSSWIGWFELNTDPLSEVATENTARVVSLLDADILGIVEAEDRTGLKAFNDTVIKKIGGEPYEHVMLIDGNDDRGIDVGIMSRSAFPIVSMRSHVDDQDQDGTIFSRDCAEYTVTVPGGSSILVLLNHLKSKGYGSQGKSDDKRLRQAQRIREIYTQRRQEGVPYIAIIGDFNDTSDSGPLAPLLQQGFDLGGVSEHPTHQGNGRAGTPGNGTGLSKLGFLPLSPALWATVQQAGVERRGVWGGKNGTLWPILPELTKVEEAASDHAALWVDLAL